MSYTINLTDGQVFAVIPDGTINTSSSMTLVGKNYAGYGAFLDENFIHLLENGSNATAPGAPLTGQLWWDSGENLLKVYNGTEFRTISAATASGTQPTNNTVGDLWFDTVNQQLYVWAGGATGWLLVGPSSSSGQGKTGAYPATIIDSGGTPHVVLELYVGDPGGVNPQCVAIISRDQPFTPQSAIPNFDGTVVNPGIQLSNTVTPGAGNITATIPYFWGSATTAQSLQYTVANVTTEVPGNAFMRSDSNTSTLGTLSVYNSSGLYVGPQSQLNISASGNTVTLANQSADGNIIISTLTNGVQTPAIFVDGQTGNVTIPNFSAAGGNTPFGTISVQSILNANPPSGAGNIGSFSNPFNTVFAKATSAQYADVAERFAADEVLAPGTVVELGGVKEITTARQELSDIVFGVISTKPAYTMNGMAGDDSTHPAVAMTGRVPVRSVGIIKKGDRLVSAGNGLARAAKPGEATAFNVIGRALEDKLSEIEGEVEAIVTIK